MRVLGVDWGCGGLWWGVGGRSRRGDDIRGRGPTERRVVSGPGLRPPVTVGEERPPSHQPRVDRGRGDDGCRVDSEVGRTRVGTPEDPPGSPLGQKRGLVGQRETRPSGDTRLSVRKGRIPSSEGTGA